MSKKRAPSAAQLVEFIEVILPAQIRTLGYVRNRRRKGEEDFSSKETLVKVCRTLENWGRDDLMPDLTTVKTLQDEIFHLENVRRALKMKGASPGDFAKHSTDFRCVLWYGTTYFFTRNQAAIVKILWENWKQKTPDVGHRTLLSAAGIVGDRIQDVFKEKGRFVPAWGTMIVTSTMTKGACRLQEPKESLENPAKKDSRKSPR